MKIFIVLFLSGFISLTAIQAHNEPHAVSLSFEEMNPAPTNAVATHTISAINTYLNQYRPPEERYQLHIFDCRQFAMDLINDAHAHGIQAHLVLLTYPKGSPHVIVGFPSKTETIYADTTPPAQNAKSPGVHLVIIDPKKVEWVPLSDLQTKGKEVSLIVTATYSSRTISGIREFPDQTLRVTSNNVKGP